MLVLHKSQCLIYVFLFLILFLFFSLLLVFHWGCGLFTLFFWMGSHPFKVWEHDRMQHSLKQTSLRQEGCNYKVTGIPLTNNYTAAKWQEIC